jgi:hypothetical protein
MCTPEVKVNYQFEGAKCLAYHFAGFEIDVGYDQCCTVVRVRDRHHPAINLGIYAHILISSQKSQNN